MTLFKTSMLNFFSLAIKVFTGLILNKIMAVYIGPSGYALASQFQNGINFITTFASGAINTGVTKYTAEYAAREDDLKSIWRTAISISMATSIIISLTIFFLADWISVKYLRDEMYVNIIRWFSCQPSNRFRNTINILLNFIANLHI